MHRILTRMELQTDTADVSSRVRALLEADERSGRWLARQLGKTPAWVQRRMVGEVDWSASELIQVARALNVQVSTFFGEVAA